MLGQRWIADDPDVTAIQRERVKRVKAHDPRRSAPAEAEHRTLPQRLAKAGFASGSRVFIRIFKLDFELEVWLQRNGRFELFATYPICRWSGGLGPKLREGDRQAPEGFYTVDATQLNPNSRWHRSFNLGFPNLYDRAWGRTGSFLMVHGGCSSAGCYAMTDRQIDEIWRLMTAALVAGQPRVHVHVLPFRLTPAALAKRRAHPAHAFWIGLEPGFRAFEAARVVPRIGLCRGRYTIEPGAERGPLAAAEPMVERCASQPTEAETALSLPIPAGTDVVSTSRPQ